MKRRRRATHEVKCQRAALQKCLTHCVHQSPLVTVSFHISPHRRRITYTTWDARSESLFHLELMPFNTISGITYQAYFNLSFHDRINASAHYSPLFSLSPRYFPHRRLLDSYPWLLPFCLIVISLYNDWCLIYHGISLSIIWSHSIYARIHNTL